MKIPKFGLQYTSFYHGLLKHVSEMVVNMKKISLVFVLCVLITVFLSSCFFPDKPYSFYQSEDQISSIEIVYAENELNHRVIKTLSEKEKEEFLIKFQRIKFRKFLGDPSIVHGDAIKINYHNGGYEIICWFTAEYVENGLVRYGLRSCDKEEFTELISFFQDNSQ